MELLLALRAIWRRRIALAVGVVLAVGVLVGLGGTKMVLSSSAVAWTRVGLDTPKSQLVKSAPDGADTLTWRAAMLMHLLTTDESQAEIARRLGVRPDEVAVIDASFNIPLRPASMPKRASEAAAVIGAPNVVTLNITDYSLPVITLEAGAADAAGAKRLAEAAVAVMASRASRGGKFQSRIDSGGTDKLQQFEVAPVAPVRATVVQEAKPPMKAIGAALFLLLGWSAVVLALPLLLRRRTPLPA